MKIFNVDLGVAIEAGVPTPSVGLKTILWRAKAKA
jgi:hypothetical protein